MTDWCVKVDVGGYGVSWLCACEAPLTLNRYESANVSVSCVFGLHVEALVCMRERENTLIV